MDSFISWIGGKKLLRRAIIERFPDNDGIDRYIEVFGGAGWVLFAKEPGRHLEVFNDIDGNLVNLYRCIKYHCDELQKEVDHLLISREQFFDGKEQLGVRGFTDIQRAARYFHIIKVSFGSDRRTFGTNRKNLAGTIERLPFIKERLRNVVIENKDFEDLIKVYDRTGALFYLDPPYYKSEKYYDTVFKREDHERLCGLLKGIKGRFIMSYNEDEYIKDLYSGFHIEGIGRKSNLSNKECNRKYRELIIKNY